MRRLALASVFLVAGRSCRNKVPQADLERVSREQLRQFALSPEEVASALHEADREVEAKADLFQALVREDARLADEAEKVYRLYLAGELDPKGFGARNRPLAARREELEAEIPRLQGEIDFLKIQHLSQEEVVSGAHDLYERWDDLSQEDRRGVVQAIVERVTVGKDEIEITLACLPRTAEPPPPPPPLKMATTYAHTPGAACIWLS
jgi:site-specific DNA recombinase